VYFPLEKGNLYWPTVCRFTLIPWSIRSLECSACKASQLLLQQRTIKKKTNSYASTATLNLITTPPSPWMPRLPTSTCRKGWKK